MLRLLSCVLFMVLLGATERVDPFLSGRPFSIANGIDEALLADLSRRGLEAAPLCSDALFLRRVHLDLIGTLATWQETTDFLADRRSDKRERLVDALLRREEYADFWSMRWCDILRVKAEFPINLWPNGVQAYHRWIRQGLRENRPHDQFVDDLLCSSGSNFRVPAVNFYRAMQGESPEAIAGTVALTLLGSRLESWPADRRQGLMALFSCVRFKGTAEWKEQIVVNDPTPRPAFTALLPDGSLAMVAAEADPRRIFSDWLRGPGRVALARVQANRLWFWLMGRGIVHPADDHGPHNPPSHPALLAYLSEFYLASGFDDQALIRHILTSHCYQQATLGAGSDAADHFAAYCIRPYEAEVLLDAIHMLLGFSDPSQRSHSEIPEPFTYIPHDQRAIALADGSITSPFLELFGRPPRDTGLLSERSFLITERQRLYLLNSSDFSQMLRRGRPTRDLIKRSRNDPRILVRDLYLTILTRLPTVDEETIAIAYLRHHGDGGGRRARQAKRMRIDQEAVADLVWALINSKEFLHRH